MEIVEVPFETLEDFEKENVLDGHFYGCQCGESYTTFEGASKCRKCRYYLRERPTKVFFTPKPE